MSYHAKLIEDTKQYEIEKKDLLNKINTYKKIQDPIIQEYVEFMSGYLSLDFQDENPILKQYYINGLLNYLTSIDKISSLLIQNVTELLFDSKYKIWYRFSYYSPIQKTGVPGYKWFNLINDDPIHYEIIHLLEKYFPKKFLTQFDFDTPVHATYTNGGKIIPLIQKQMAQLLSLDLSSFVYKKRKIGNKQCIGLPFLLNQTGEIYDSLLKPKTKNTKLSFSLKAEGLYTLEGEKLPLIADTNLAEYKIFHYVDLKNINPKNNIGTIVSSLVTNKN